MYMFNNSLYNWRISFMADNHRICVLNRKRSLHIPVGYYWATGPTEVTYIFIVTNIYFNDTNTNTINNNINIHRKCVYLRGYVCIYICMCMWMHICIYMSIYGYYMCVYVCILMCIYHYILLFNIYSNLIFKYITYYLLIYHTFPLIFTIFQFFLILLFYYF